VKAKGTHMHPSASPQPRDRAAINRENAQHSTGPITPEGKANIKLNTLRHGACAQQIVLPGEDQDAYETLGRDLADHWQPVNTHERKLVRTLQENEWRLGRLRAAETNLWSLGTTEQFENYAQYDEPTCLASPRPPLSVPTPSTSTRSAARKGASTTY
jgi:hypothetical protein